MKNPGIKFGLLGAALVVAYFGTVYFIQKSWFLDPFVQWLPMVIYLACMYWASVSDHRLNGFNRDFRLRTRIPFLVFILINLGYWMFYYGLHLADPALVQMENAMELADLRARVSAGVGDPNQANQLREQIQNLENTDTVVALGPILLRMCMGAIGGFGLAAAVVYLIPQKRS